MFCVHYQFCDVSSDLTPVTILELRSGLGRPFALRRTLQALGRFQYGGWTPAVQLFRRWGPFCTGVRRL